MISAAGTVLRSYDSREISYSECIQELSLVSAESHQPAPKSSSGSEGRNKKIQLLRRMSTLPRNYLYPQMHKIYGVEVMILIKHYLSHFSISR